jgi:putative effector of murein hydrolase LrgA (UPF0299 family)
MDEELGRMVRAPQYAEYTALELLAVLTDQIREGTHVERTIDRFVAGFIFGATIMFTVLLITKVVMDWVETTGGF